MFERENSEVFVTQTVILVKIKERNHVFYFGLRFFIKSALHFVQFWTHFS